MGAGKVLKSLQMRTRSCWTGWELGSEAGWGDWSLVEKSRAVSGSGKEAWSVWKGWGRWQGGWVCAAQPGSVCRAGSWEMTAVGLWS